MFTKRSIRQEFNITILTLHGGAYKCETMFGTSSDQSGTLTYVKDFTYVKKRKKKKKM